MFRGIRRYSITLAEELAASRITQYHRHRWYIWEDAVRQEQLTATADSKAEPVINDLARQCVRSLNNAVDSRDRSRSAAKLLFPPNDSMHARHWSTLISHLKGANYGVQNLGIVGVWDDELTFVVKPGYVKRVENGAELRKIAAEHKKNSYLVLRVSLEETYPQ